MTARPPQTLSTTIDRHDRSMVMAYPRFPVVMTRGDGSYLFDESDNRYLDLFPGYGAGVLGHCHPALVSAVTKQSRKLWHVGNLLHTDPQTRVADAIARHGFGGRSFFCHSGADANEAAFKLARLHGKANPGSAGPRHKVISCHDSFHGRSFATMMATGQAKVRGDYEPFLQGFEQVPYGDIGTMTAAIDKHTAAVIVEPIQGEGGVNVPTDEYLPRLRTLCDKNDVLLIVDEVWTGCGRTGRYFAHQHWGIEPDIMTLAKGVGAGLPVGVMCARPDIARHFAFSSETGARHATTLGGNCISMAASAAVFETLEADGLVERARELGQYTHERALDLAVNVQCIREIRGKGLFIGLALDPDQAWFDSVADVLRSCFDQGLIVGGAQHNVLRLAPALTVNREQIDQGLETLRAVLVGE